MGTTQHEKAISSVLKAVSIIKRGGMIILVDDEDRENEGDLVFAADYVTPEHINFMARQARGLICLTLEPQIVGRLNLPMMTDSTRRQPEKETAFTVSIEARTGVTTGISAADRARTIKVAIDPASVPDDIVVPGHIFPIKARPGGVLRRAGHTEGSVDLARLAGLTPAGVICEIMNEDGTMSRMPDLEKFSTKHNVPIVTIADLITYRLLKESYIEEIGRKPIKTPYGIFDSVLFRNKIDGLKHLAIIRGEESFKDEIVDVRVHAQKQLADVLGDREKSSGYKIDYGLRMLADSIYSVLIYLQKSEDGNRIFEDDLNQLFLDTQQTERSSQEQYSFNMKMLGTGAQIIRSLGINRMRVHTSTPGQSYKLSGFGLEITEVKLMAPYSRYEPANFYDSYEAVKS
ncbi:MAG: 3,4-dihydroxy-2-butanone-4-phosphate synthase [Oligoflexales bacterium]|nr:3,4-dihydroxy-2-butanone-4-phosphate synthase [Oligoflexales bacterium]